MQQVMQSSIPPTQHPTTDSRRCHHFFERDESMLTRQPQGPVALSSVAHHDVAEVSPG